jgi:RNA polymerase sigma-70 factor, ECF subfamily
MTRYQSAGPDEQSLLDAARRGDEHAYDELVEPHRPELHAHCYRMLASVHDADDAVQEALVRAWKGLARFEGRSSVRTWLFRIATNAALDTVRGRGRRELPVELLATGRPLHETKWLEPYPDQTLGAGAPPASPEARYETRESLELSFVAALQYLTADQRAVLILREVVGFSASETAEALDTTVPAVNSSLQRARKAAAGRIPDRNQQLTLRTLGEDGVRVLAERYADAIERSDIDELCSMLTQDATWAMPPDATYYRGQAEIAAFLARDVSRERWRHLTSQANGQLAVGCYTFVEEQSCFVASVLDVLTLDDDRIASVTAFFTTSQLKRMGHGDDAVGAVEFSRYGLPETLPDLGI